MKLEKIYDRAYNWLFTHGPDVVFAIIIFFIGLWFIKFLRSRIQTRMSKRKVNSSLQPFFLSLSITGLYILLLITVMEIIGFRITMFTTIIGAFSVAAGLALSGTFQNFAGGVLILLLKPFETGDYIVAQGHEGNVTSILIFYTVLLTIDNKTVIIPNGKLFNEVIVNVSRENRRRLDFEVKLGYAADIDKAKKIMLNAVKSNKDVLPTPPIRVGLVGLEIDSIRFTVNVWVEPANYLNVKIDLMEGIIKDLGAGGIPFPKAG
jgi:small conductance mechanosensitive channel